MYLVPLPQQVVVAVVVQMSMPGQVAPVAVVVLALVFLGLAVVARPHRVAQAAQAQGTTMRVAAAAAQTALEVLAQVVQAVAAARDCPRP